MQLGTNSMNGILLKKCAPIIRIVKLMPKAGQWDMHGKRFWVLRVSMSAASLLSFFSLFSFLFGSGTTARICRVSAQWQPRSCRQRAMAKSLRPVNRKKEKERVDGKEAVGNSLGRAPWGRRGMEATTGETVGNSMGRELRWEGAIRKRRQGGRTETAGNSMGRALLGRSDTEATRGWTEGKPWEIAWGELRWEEATY